MVSLRRANSTWRGGYSHGAYFINSCLPGQNGSHFTDDIFKWMKIYWFRLKFHWPNGLISNIPAWSAPRHYLNQSWPNSLTHIYVAIVGVELTTNRDYWPTLLFMVCISFLCPYKTVLCKYSSIHSFINSLGLSDAYIWVGKMTIIGSDNGLLPGRRQAIIWNSGGILLIGPLGTNSCEILIGIQTFSFKKMHP